MTSSIRKKLIIYIVPIVLLILILSYHITMINSRTLVEQEIYLTIEAKQNEQSKTIEDAIVNVKSISDIFASSVASSYEYLTPDIYNKILTNVLYQDPKISSVGVWFEPYAGKDRTQYERYYASNDNGSYIVYNDYNAGKFDYLNYELYLRSKELNKGFFSEAHYNVLTNTYAITYLSPIQNSNGNFIGCISLSCEVRQLKELVDEYNSEFLNFYIIDKAGVYIGHTDLDLVKSQKNIKDCNDDFTEIAESILSTESGTITHVKNGQEYYIYYDTISEFEWKLVYEVPASYIHKPLIQLTLINLVVALFSVSIIIFIILMVTNKFVHKPLQLLLGEFKNISNNDYDSNIPNQLLETKTEFSDIGNALTEMKTNLISYQDRLKNKNELLVANEKTLNTTVDYVHSIINALPIMMFVFNREGVICELHGKTPFKNRTKDFYVGKHYRELLSGDEDECKGFHELLDILKTIDYDDGVVQSKISTFVNGTLEHFEHNLSLVGENLIISLCRRITDTVNHIQDMKYLSDFDELTGLYNSRYFIDMLKKHTEYSSLPISIIVCDINGFKSINDKYGFEFGDSLLVDLTVALNNIDVKNKTVSRVAGDEFAVILPNTSKAEAEAIIENVSTECLLGKVSKFPFSLAYGVDTETTNKESLLPLIKSVEEVLYKQKVYTSSGLKDNSIGLINSIFHAKNKREQLHSDRVSELCLEMAKALGWSKLNQSKISTAGLLHDIGKIGISETILNKPGRLNDDEYKEMCTHPEIGYRILQSFENMKELSEYAYSHHEKWDGTGYPRQLKGTEIPIEARILAIADTYDAITSSRSYRDGLPKEVAIAELIRCKNTQFDPELVDIFIEKVLLEKLEDYMV